jgi:small subunit ribosomal protein S20
LANTRSAKKRIRQNVKRRMRNKLYRTHARTQVKTARQLIEGGERDTAVEAVRQAVGALDRAVSKGVIHRNNAARRKSRLLKRLAEME